MPSTSSSERPAARFSAPTGEIHVLATVQGLVSGRDRVRNAVAHLEPTAIGIGASPESAAALLRYEPQGDVDLFEDLPDHDYVYSVVLREFGEVGLPPPDLLEAARIAAKETIPFYGIDMPDEAYETLFTKEVSTLGFLRYGRIQRRLAKRPPRVATAEAFSLAWDQAIRRVKGIRRVEAAREQHIAEQARALVAKHPGNVLLVIDVARAAGVQAHLGGG